MSELRVFTCTDHDYHNPVGVCSVIVAHNRRIAKTLLDKELVACGLKPFAEEEYTLNLVDIKHSNATILLDGEY